MLRGLYTASSGMIAQQRKHDTATNNIANMNTPGYKQSTALSRSFPEMLISRFRDDETGTQQVGRLHTGVLMEENVAIPVQGVIEETRNPFDFAIVSDLQVPGAAFNGAGIYVNEDGETIYKPQAYFMIENQAGEIRYTSNGKFHVDGNGFLVNAEGLRVLDNNRRPMQLINLLTNEPIKSVQVSNEGNILDENGYPYMNANEEPVRIGLAKVSDPHKLMHEGNGLYYLNQEDQALAEDVQPGDNVMIRQGFVEQSNVDPTQVMVDMMSALRAYEANQKMVQFYDKSLEKTVNEVGRI